MEVRNIFNNFWLNTKSCISELKLGIYYRMWKKRIYKYGGYQRGSKIMILDAGCGCGHFLKWLERYFPYAAIYGIDLDEQKLTIASQRLKITKLINQDVHNLPFKDETFEIVSALQILEHLEEPEIFLREVNRILKNNGLLIIATPNPSGIAVKLLKEKWHGYNTEHISLKPPDEWKIILKNLGFNILEDGTKAITGFKFLRTLPLSLINWIPMAIFGFFHWYKGESYMAIARKIL